ncbi:MAG: hypothetical protein AAF564_24690 [Bacteroidota bacterium]
MASLYSRINQCVILLLFSAVLPLPILGQQVEADQRWSQRFGGHIEFASEIDRVVVAGDDLYAVGSFLRVGNAVAVGVARWDGIHWQALEGGDCDHLVLLQTNALCHFKTVFAQNDTLFAFADVSTLEDPFTGLSLLKWDDSGWTRVYK